VILDVYGPAQTPGMPGFGGPPQGGDGKPPIKVTSEDYTNSVVVFGLPNQHDDIAALIKDLDKNATTTLESKLFQLKYVPADQVLSAIEDVLTANTPTGRAGKKSSNDNQNQGYYFNYYGGGSQNRQKTAGGQSATAVKQTNSVIVNATPENLVLVRALLDKLDQPAAFLGTTFVIRLQNAKATDLADLLNKSLTQKSNNNDDFIRFFYFGDSSENNKKGEQSVDFNEKGEIVNVRDLIGNVNVTADPNTNSLIVVTQPSNMKMINEIIAKLDQVADQVVIETIIVEANLDKTTKLGVEWAFNNTSLFGDKGTIGGGKTDFGLQPAAGVGQGAAYTITGLHYKAFVNALQTDTRFKVLDTPRIFTSNNVKAEINVSQRQPYITSQETNTGGNLVSNYQFVDIGVVLRVTPRITSSGQVVMDVSQSADDLQGYTSFNAPIINHREATTTVSVKDGSTVVLGGIIRNTLSSTDKKVPLLGDIPLFGHLFRSSTKTTGQTELLVFLTPHIVRSNADAQKIREDVTKELTKSSQDSLKKQIPPDTGKGSGQ
jgi:general secretion pathway protein D